MAGHIINCSKNANNHITLTLFITLTYTYDTHKPTSARLLARKPTYAPAYPYNCFALVPVHCTILLHPFLALMAVCVLALSNCVRFILYDRIKFRHRLALYCSHRKA